MKKNLLLVSFLTLTGVAFAQTPFNWIQNGGFEADGFTLQRSTDKKFDNGNWIVYAQSDQDNFKAELKDDNDATHNSGKVVEVDCSTTTKLSWYKSNLSQVLNYDLQPAMYILRFDARAIGDATPKLSTIIYTGNYTGKDNFFLKDGFDKDVNATASGARYDVALTNDWDTYEVKFDMSQYCNNVNSPQKVGSAYVVAETTEADLAGARVIFNTNAKALVFQIDNIELVPVDPSVRPDGVDPDPEPEPEPTPTTNVLANSDFEGSTAGAIEPVTGAGTVVGDWSVYLKNGKTGFSGEIVTENGEHGNVVKMSYASGPGWYEAYLCQNIKDNTVKAEVYTLSFDAKLVDGNALVRTWIYLNNATDNKFALKEGFDGAATPTLSGTAADFALTSEWQHFTLNYDMSKYCNSYNSAGSNGWIAENTTEAMLEKVRVCFNTNVKNATIILDNIKLEPVNGGTVDPDPTPDPEPDPEPEVPADPELPAYVEVDENGVFLMNGDFEDAAPIQIWRTKDESKFLGYTGTWYFYQEQKDGVELDASVVTLEDDAEHGKVAALTNAAKIGDWWGRCLMQRVGRKLEQGVYTLGFYARADGNAQLRICFPMKLKEGVKVAGYAVKEEFEYKDGSKASGTLYDVSPAYQWTYYEQNFDFSRMINTIWSVSSADAILGIDNEEVLSNVYLSMWNNTASQTLLVDGFEMTDPNDPSHISDVATTDKVRSFVVDGGIEVAGLTNAQVAVYDLNGATVAQTAAANGTWAQALPQGAYIVKVVAEGATKAMKVIVK